MDPQIHEKEPVFGHQNLILPRFKCHKVVAAAKILAIFPEPNFDGAQLQLDIPNRPLMLVESGYMDKHEPVVGGYYVVYTDGYASFSPGDVFEDGYTRIEEEVEAQH